MTKKQFKADMVAPCGLLLFLFQPFLYMRTGAFLDPKKG